MRVLVLIKGLGIGGAERLISSGAAHWDRTRFDYAVAYVLPWKNALVDELAKHDVPVTCVGGRRGFDPAVPHRLRQLVGSHQPDLVHAHLPSTGILARLTLPVPIVYTEHNLPSSYRQPTRTLNRLTYARNTAVVAVSEAVRDDLAGFPGTDPVVIENGVDVPEDTAAGLAARQELGLGPDDPLVVHVGNIRPHKGHETLLRSAKILLERRPDVTLVSIGGEKYDGGLASLQDRAAGLGLVDRMRFLGSRADALSFVAACDVFVNPADIEGLPVAILEALSLGRPVVATDVGGVSSVIEDGVTGRLVPPGNPGHLAEAVAGLLDDSETAAQMGANARESIVRSHGLEGMVREYEKLYLDLLASEPR